MSSENFQVGVANRDGDVVLELVGTVTRAAKDEIEQAYGRAGKEGRILLDFSGVDYINSTGIAVIVGMLGMARADQRDVGAFGLSDHYRKVFEITRLSDFMTMYDNEAAAAAAAN
jgi:anti-anti-sigma factor